MSAISAETPESEGFHGTAVLISDLADACAVLSSDAGAPSRTLALLLAIAFPDGGIGPPTAPGTFPVVDALTSSSGPDAGPVGEVIYENQLDGGCVAWLTAGGSIELVSLDPVEGTFSVTLATISEGEPLEAQLSGSFTATACPSIDFALLSCSE